MDFFFAVIGKYDEKSYSKQFESKGILTLVAWLWVEIFIQPIADEVIQAVRMSPKKSLARCLPLPVRRI